ncbi:MAG: thermonuclease family protein [Anaerolineales bacterium]|nr:thermonuclease family protein [Anaerolineales bacterium]
MATVTNIVDGDTIDVNLDGQIVRVRYIGIDTPEYNEQCGSEATQANASLVAGRTVRMVKDVSETDRYGRLLRYVYVGNLFINAELVRQGLAIPVRYPPDTSQATYLESLTAASPVCQPIAPLPQPTPIPPTAVPAPLPTSIPPQQNCDPSYPTVCIPSPPPDLDCGDIPFRRFQVLQPDPHGFDRDKDGIGCESS